MFKAIDVGGIEFNIDETQQNIQYYCPVCKKEVIVKAKRSQSVAAHYAHRRKQDCDTFSHDMSEWHKQWQARFPLRNREVPLPFDHPCHRAVVLAFVYVIEFQ